jgi:hypothetical protein
MEFHDPSRWSEHNIWIEEARLICIYGREDLGTGTLLNDGEFGPYNYDPILRSEAARKAAKTWCRSKEAKMANESRRPEGRSLAAKAAAWTRTHGPNPAANPYLKANRNTDQQLAHSRAPDLLSFSIVDLVT